MDNILVMLSGGIDSTWVLLYYLKNTEIPIYTHHIILRCDVERRFHQETKATNSVLEWMNKEYPGRIVKNYNSNWWMNSNVSGKDIDLSLFIGATVASRLPGDTAVATGRNLEDDGIDGAAAANKVWKSFAETYDGLVWETLKPGKDLHKSEIIDQLPEDLLELTWSCRSSSTDTQCGKCHACLLNKGELIK